MNMYLLRLGNTGARRDLILRLLSVFSWNNSTRCEALRPRTRWVTLLSVTSGL